MGRSFGAEVGPGKSQRWGYHDRRRASSQKTMPHGPLPNMSVGPGPDPKVSQVLYGHKYWYIKVKTGS